VKAADIPDDAVLEAVAAVRDEHGDAKVPDVMARFPEAPRKVVWAKLQSMERAGLARRVPVRRLPGRRAALRRQHRVLRHGAAARRRAGPPSPGAFVSGFWLDVERMATRSRQRPAWQRAGLVVDPVNFDAPALPSPPMTPVATDTQALALLRALADLLRYPFDDGVPSSVTDHADRLQAAIDAGDAPKVKRERDQAARYVDSQHYLIIDRMKRTLDPEPRPEPKRR
jgi:hypothetical protein